MLAPKKANDYKISNNKEKGKENDTEKYTGSSQTRDYAKSSAIAGSTIITKFQRTSKFVLQISFK